MFVLLRHATSRPAPLPPLPLQDVQQYPHGGDGPLVPRGGGEADAHSALVAMLRTQSQDELAHMVVGLQTKL
eukprot:9801046-Alexandrium_andersonii.AAC.1